MNHRFNRRFILGNKCSIWWRMLMVGAVDDMGGCVWVGAGSTWELLSVQFSSVAQSCLTLQPHEPQHARPPCPSPTPGAYSNSCPLSQWCPPTISSSVVPFSSCPQSLPASGSFPVSQLFAWGGQSIGVSASASVLPMNTQDWSPFGWTGWTSLQSRNSQESPPTPQFKSWILCTFSQFSSKPKLVGKNVFKKVR